MESSQSSQGVKKEPCRGAWTPEEDHKLVQVIEKHGPKRWKYIAAKAGTSSHYIYIPKLETNNSILTVSTMCVCVYIYHSC